ncbi:MAG: hypothetical protein ACKOAL_11970, partial [Chthoniobacterales bacterium]
MKLIIALLLATSAALPAANPPADLSAWESLTVQDSGRRKPLGTFGHEVLVKIAGRDPVTLKEGSKVAGTEFTFAKFYATRDFSEEPIILISYRPLVERLGLDASRKRFSRKELAGANELAKLAQEAAALRQAGEPVPRLDTEAQTVLGRMQLFDALGST